jgi:hypothetical protein
VLYLRMSTGPRNVGRNDPFPAISLCGEQASATMSCRRFTRLAVPDFMAVVEKMRTVTKGPAERRYYQLHSAR